MRRSKLSGDGPRWEIRVEALDAHVRELDHRFVVLNGLLKAAFWHGDMQAC